MNGAATKHGFEQQKIETIVRHVRDQNYGFKALIHEVVQSQLFQSK